MTNAQTNLAGLGTQPVKLEVGSIIANQMNFLAERMDKVALAKKQAEVERAKRNGEVTNKFSVLDYKNVPDYLLNQYNKAYQDAINDNQRIAKELQNNQIDEAEAIRQYTINKNIPEQLYAFGETVKTSYEQMRDGKGDSILNADREEDLNRIASGGITLIRDEDGSQKVVLRDGNGKEGKYSLSEAGMMINHGNPYYDKEYDTNATAKSYAESSKTVKADNGYEINENVTFEAVQPTILEAVRKTAGSYEDFRNWDAGLKKSYKEMNGTYASPKNQEEAEKFFNDFTNTKVRAFFKEKSSKEIDPTMEGRLRGQELENQNKVLTAKEHKLNIQKKQNDLNKAEGGEGVDYAIVNTSIGKGGKDQRPAIGFNVPTGKEIKYGDTVFRSVIVGNNGKIYGKTDLLEDGAKNTNGVGNLIEIKTRSEQDNVSMQLNLNGLDELLTKANERLGANTNKKPSNAKPTVTQKVVEGAKTLTKKYFSGNNSNQPIAPKKGLAKGMFDLK